MALFGDSSAADASRLYALQLLNRGTGRAPQNVGEGLHSAGASLMGALLARQAQGQDDANRQGFAEAIQGARGQGLQGDALVNAMLANENPMAQKFGQNLLAAQLSKTPASPTPFNTWLTGGPEGRKAVEDYTRATAKPDKPTPFSAFMSGDPEQRAAAEQYFAANRSPGTSVRITQGPQVGTIPQGYKLMRGEDGSMWMEAIAGSPAETELNDAEKAKIFQKGVNEAKRDLVNQTVDRIENTIKESTLPVAGPAGAALSNVWGTDAYEVSVDLQNLASQNTLEALKAARAGSSTGASGFGALSEREGQLLSDSFGALRQSVGTPAFERQLSDYKRQYNRIIHGLNPDGTPYSEQWEPQKQQSAPGTTEVPQQKDRAALRREYGLE